MSHPAPFGRLATYRALLSSKFSQGVVWNVGSLAFLAVGGILINLLVARLRGEAALGIFNQAYAVYIVLSQVGVGGLQHSVLKHISYHQTDRALCGDITTAALVLVTAFSLPLSAATYALAGPVGDLLSSAAVADGIRLVAPGLIFFALNKVLINTLNGLQWMRAYAVFRSLRFVLIPAFIVVVVALDLGDAYLALSLTLAEAVLFVALAAYVYGRVVPLRRIAQAGQRYREHLSFGLRGVLSGMLMELNTRVDVLMLGYFVSDAQVGVFSFAAIMAEGFAQLPLAVRWNVDPLLGAHFASGQLADIVGLARRIRRVFVPAMLGLGLASAVVYPLLYGLMVGGDGLAESWGVYALIALGVVVGSGYRPFGGLLLQAGRPGLFTLSIIALVLMNVVLNAAFIPAFGILGAAVATMFTYIGEAVLLAVLARRLFGLAL